MVPALKDRAILAGWIVGLALAGALAWALTFSFRMNVMMEATNRALAASGDPRRLSEPLPRDAQGRELLGGWYALADSDSVFFVFAVLRGGSLAPHGAEVSPDGRALSVVPLGVYARQAAQGIPDTHMRVYERRVEAAHARRAGK